MKSNPKPHNPNRTLKIMALPIAVAIGMAIYSIVRSAEVGNAVALALDLVGNRPVPHHHKLGKWEAATPMVPYYPSSPYIQQRSCSLCGWAQLRRFDPSALTNEPSEAVGVPVNWPVPLVVFCTNLSWTINR